MKMLKIKNIEGKLVPWGSREELSNRIFDNFNWNFPGDPLPEKLTDIYNPTGHCSEIWPADELYAIMNQLLEEYEINQEIIRQAKENLVEITRKSNNKLKGHIPRYLNSFWIGDVRHFEVLFNHTLDAAYYVINNPVFKNTEPPKEDEIMFAAVKGMLGYSDSNPKEVLKFLDNLNNKQFIIPYLLTGYIGLKSEKAITTYFDLFDKADGQDDFILNGIKREVGFNFIGKRLKKAFPNQDCHTEINKSKINLRKSLKKIFE